jgi:hypothetical protein
MATPSSGTISLNEMHVEAGGSSGTTCSINDADIRLIADKSSGATASWNDYYARAADYAISMTTGGTSTSSSDGYVTTTIYYRGYLNSSPSGAGDIGSLNVSNDPDYLDNASGFSDLSITSINQGATATSVVRVRASKQNIPNNDTSFKSVLISSTTFNRSDATYETSNGRSQWYWSTTTTPPFDNTSTWTPFSASGSTTSVTFRRSR